MKGTIFDIQRFSVHDGPGIRTTVFMKGCPLRCRWCHNPEGLSPELQLQFFQEACIGCGSCGERKNLSDAEACPAQALKVCGQDVDADTVMQVILRDRIFYADTGGVTFSGGECLLQADFVAEVLSYAKEQNLHTAIDTSGCVPWSAFEKTMDVCDLYLYDVKCIDAALHRAHTDVSNGQILENLRRLAKQGANLWIRTPVIPGFNNTDKEMQAIADFLSDLPHIGQVTLMPYHTLGASKYATLGMDYPFDITKKISDEEMARFKAIFLDRGLHLA